jgi:hypothetical protein
LATPVTDKAARQSAKDLKAVQRAGDRDVQLQVGSIATSVSELVMRHAVKGPSGTLTLNRQARRRIMRDIDPILNTIYPPSPGAASPLQATIMNAAGAAVQLAYTRSAQSLVTDLQDQPDLIRAMRDGRTG